MAPGFLNVANPQNSVARDFFAMADVGTNTFQSLLLQLEHEHANEAFYRIEVSNRDFGRGKTVK